MLAKIKLFFSFQDPRLKKIVLFSLILSILGIADTIYLTVAHYAQTVTLACPDTGIINCAKVTSSSYSEVYGVPVALIGLIFFLILFVIQLPIFWTDKYIWLKLPRQIFISIGLLGVFWFVYVELHFLHAICLYCTGIHILTFLSFVTVLFASEHFQIDKQ